MKLLIAGGGTGGHVFPALAVAREWLRRGKEREVVMVGTERGLEARLVGAAGLPLETVRAAGLKGMRPGRLLRNLATLPLALADSFRVLHRHKPQVAFGTGGYASGPALFAAAWQGVPVVLFESNVVPGLANRLLAPLATRVAVAHEEAAQYFLGRARVTGCPVRPEFFRAPRRVPHAAGEPFTVLVTGGSQGAQAINRAVTGALDRLAAHKHRLRLIHQTGEREYEAVREAYARRGLPAEVVAFLDDMPERFAQADLILCRAGALTVAEVAAAGRAALLVPFAAATDSHQLRNAALLAEAGAARMIREEELTPARLAEEILALLDQPQHLAEMGERARAFARSAAVEAIVNLLEEVAP